MEHHRETAQNPEKYVGQLLPHVQRRAAGRHVLIKKNLLRRVFLYLLTMKGRCQGACFDTMAAFK